MERFKQLGGGCLAAVGQVGCHRIALEVLPEPLAGIEVVAVRGKIKRLDVMPVERCGFVPASVEEHQIELFADLGRDFFRHGIEEDLEHLGVVVRDDQSDQAARCGLDIAADVAPVMSALIALGRPAAALGPFVARGRIAFETALVTEEDHGGRILKQGLEATCIVLVLMRPDVSVG